MNSNAELVTRFWERVFNQRDLSAVESIVTDDLSWRGSLGPKSRGLDGFFDYAHKARKAIPDLHVALDDVVAAGDHVFARLTLSGSHGGTLLGVPATGRRFSYEAAAVHRCRDGRIEEAWVVGDTHALYRQLTCDD
ncbi:MAG: ester cyclase [Actinomycetota bacterium]|nr:ester cyclase [Actinomycetota bacterium]